MTEERESPCCGAEWSQHMVIQEDILVGAVLHKKSVWDHSYLHKAKTFILVSGMGIVFNHGIELH